MTERLKICVVTGSRAEYGLLEPVLEQLVGDPEISLQLVATGMHLSPEFGRTESVIASDGYEVDARVEMLLSSDSSVGIAKSVGLGIIGFADVFDRLEPDLLLVLGDRFEMFAAAQAALLANIPIAHIAGGDTTEGAIDEAIRHSVTKMSHIHLVTNEAAFRRVVQMGEAPDRVHQVGSPGLDNLRRYKLLGRDALSRELGISFRNRNILVTFHPVTLEPDDSEAHFVELLEALAQLGDDYGLYFTKANADAGGRALNERLDRWLVGRENAKAFTSLGQLRYLSLMSVVDVIVGNSSSGLYEAPSLKRPTVDIGSRQRGRLAATSVVRCEPQRKEIADAINQALQLDCRSVVNPYGDGRSAMRILEVLKLHLRSNNLLKKSFNMSIDGHVSS